MNAEIEFFSDTLIMDKMMKIIAIHDCALVKEASFDVSSFLEGIKSGVQSQVDKSSPVESVVNLLLPGALWKISPIFGLLATGAELAGFNLFSIWRDITQPIISKVQAGEKITPQDVNEIGQQHISANASFENYTSINVLSEMDRNGLISLGSIKTGSGKSWFGTIFGNLLGSDTSPGKTKARFSILNFIIGILTWTIKSILLSAGLLTIGGGIMGLLGKKPQGPGTQNEQAEQNEQSNQPSDSSGSSGTWIVPLEGQTPPEMLMEWATDKFPALQGHEDEIDQTPAFWNTVREITKDYRPGQSQIQIPPQFKTPQDILSKFVPDVMNELELK
jgi:hypothetical protein